MSLKTDRIEKQILALSAANPRLTQGEMADILDCSTKTIQRYMQKNAPTLEAIDDKLTEVRAKLKERIPIEKRVEVLATIAESSEMDFARLGAVKYINELDDIHPDLERKKALKVEPEREPVTITVVHVGGDVKIQPAIEVKEVGKIEDLI
jgi:hypothetical protein